MLVRVNTALCYGTKQNLSCVGKKTKVDHLSWAASVRKHLLMDKPVWIGFAAGAIGPLDAQPTSTSIILRLVLFR